MHEQTLIEKMVKRIERDFGKQSGYVCEPKFWTVDNILKIIGWIATKSYDVESETYLAILVNNEGTPDVPETQWDYFIVTENGNIYQGYYQA